MGSERSAPTQISPVTAGPVEANPTGPSPGRAALVLMFIAVALLSLIARVAYLQTYGRQQTILKAERQHHQTQPLAARRGSIFDRNGTLIACTIQNRGVFIDPKFMQERYQDENRWVQLDTDLPKLAALLGIDALELAQMLSDRSEERYIKLSDCVSGETEKKIRALRMPGVGFMPVNHRVYPLGSLAGHIIGGVGKGQIGLEGIEMKFELDLAGKDGSQRVLKDAKRRAIGVAEEDYVPPQHGRHLVLTIDANIQLIAEQELEAACDQFRAKRGEVVVMDPKTGEVLALANYPGFNPQEISETPPEIRRNAALVAPYEPGSAIKPFIVGPAIDRKITSPGDVWPISGISWFTPYGRRISDVHGYGPLTTWDILVKSSNVGMAMLGQKMGNPALHEALTSFGFGKRTGIELGGEDPGLVRELSAWSKHSTDSVVQGYELMVTPLQLARAFCAYANGGKLPTVRLVKGVLDADGNVVTSRPPPAFADLPQVVTPETAAQIRRILADVPLRGTATSIKRFVPGTRQYEVPTWYMWNIFGKTGTAHISEGRAGYSHNRYNSTFLAGAPYENPRLVVAITLHEPDRSIAHYGGTVSGPAGAKILGRALTYLQVPPSPELAPPPPEITKKLVNYQPSVYIKPSPDRIR